MAKAKAKSKSASHKKRPAHRHNPSHASAHHKSRRRARRNPSLNLGGPIIKEALAAGGGALLTTFARGFVPGSITQGNAFIGAGVTLGVAWLVGKLAAAIGAGKETVKAAVIGGGSVAVVELAQATGFTPQRFFGPRPQPQPQAQGMNGIAVIPGGGFPNVARGVAGIAAINR